MHSTNVSGKHLIAQTQLRFIVKNEFVVIYGISVSSEFVFGANTLNVAQEPSSFSILKTLEHDVSPGHVIFSLTVGMLHGVPFPQQVYSITGLVLHNKVLALQPKKPLSQVSKLLSAHPAFC